MAFREVTMLEVKEVQRLWLLGVQKRRVAQQLGLDVKTVRRYLAAARARGVEPAHGAEALTDELVSAMAAVQGGAGRPRGDGWATCDEHRALIEGRPGGRVRLTKVRKLLLRQGVEILYRTLRCCALEQLGSGRSSPTVPVADCESGAEVQLDTGWMTKLEPDVLGRRLRFRAWIFTAVRSRTASSTPCCGKRPRRHRGLRGHPGLVRRDLQGGIVDNAKEIVASANPIEPKIVQTFLDYA